MKIRVSKSELKAVGKQLISNANDIYTEGEKINSVINELAGYWEGLDRDLLVNLTKDVYLVNLEKERQRVESYGKYLQEIPNVYEEVDNTYMKKKIK